MTVASHTFLPDSLRPQPKAEPRSRRGFRIRLVPGPGSPRRRRLDRSLVARQDVSVQTCAGIPASVAIDLEGLRGHWVPAVDLGWVRRHVEQWPGVGTVDVELQLPGKLVVRAVAEEVCGSVPVGLGWRAVSCDGRPSRRLDRPQAPVFRGFGADEVQLRRALAVGRRFGGAGEGDVLSVRRVTPVDYEVRLGPQAGEPVTVRVLPGGSLAETWWKQKWAGGRAPLWADLRFDDRVVVGGLG